MVLKGGECGQVRKVQHCEGHLFVPQLLTTVKVTMNVGFIGKSSCLDLPSIALLVEPGTSHRSQIEAGVEP